MIYNVINQTNTKGDVNMKGYEVENADGKFSVDIWNDYKVNFYILNHGESGSMTIGLDEFKEMVKDLNEMLSNVENEIKSKEWDEQELRQLLGQSYYFYNQEDFELACIEQGFEKQEFGTYKKVY